MENETIWKVGLVVLVLLAVVGIYNNNNRFTEEATGEAIGDSITGMVIGGPDEIGIFKQVGIGMRSQGEIHTNYKLDVSGRIFVNNPGAQIDFADGKGFRKWVIGPSGSTGDDFIIYDATPYSDGIRIKIGASGGALTVNNLSAVGSGNAYVCVNQYGKLYRSNILCV